MDPESVAGILFMNRTLRHNQARIVDIAPTILEHLGVPVPASMDPLFDRPDGILPKLRRRVMTISEMLLPEFDQEMANTRKLLERVPEDKWDYKPHAKSMALGRLAAHVAELPFWAKHTLSVESLDIKPGEQPFMVTSARELLETFDKNVAEAGEALAKASDADMAKIWTLSFSGRPVFSMPRSAVLRGSVMNHLIHHRAQLGVYLRLNDVAIPGMYGPSADETKFWEAGASAENEKKKLVRDRLAGLGYA